LLCCKLLTKNLDLPEGGMKWLRTIPIFLAVLISSTLAIFNYQKSSSSVVSSTLYALRTSPKAREYLGDEIYFAHKMPWIWGEMNQLHGRIDITFEVKGTKASGTMRFTSHRKTRMGMFETTEWSLETYETHMVDGKEVRRKIDLLDGEDPFVGIEVDEEPKAVGRGSYAPNLSG
jgi:cytochrome c oxidase assembly factor 1